MRLEPDGTKVYRKNNKVIRVAPADPADWRSGGYYGPCGSRAEFLAGRKDYRNTDEFAEIVREQRANGVRSGKAVKPGPQK